MYKITFQIEGATPVIMEANKGDNLLELARRGNVAIDAPCSGNGSCGKCRVKLVSGQVESAPSRHITPEEYQEGWRLACSCKVVEDAEILVPDIASALYCHPAGCTGSRHCLQNWLSGPVPHLGRAQSGRHHARR